MDNVYMMIGCGVIILVAVLIHQTYPKEGFYQSTSSSHSQSTPKIQYVGGSPWKQNNVTHWQRGLQDIYTSFEKVQKDVQDIYDIYVSVESQLETAARKKHKHWVTMTSEQRQHAKMVNDPLTEYYSPLKTQSHPTGPLGGLKDNEGGLPFGIPRVGLPHPDAIIQFQWKPGSSGESTFYTQSRQYVSTLTHAIKRLEQHVQVLEWSTRGNKIVSLLPRIQAMKERADVQSKHLQKRKQEHSNENFETTRTVTVYSFNNALQILQTSQEKLSNLRNILYTTRNDVLQAKHILTKMNDQGKATHAKLTSAISK